MSDILIPLKCPVCGGPVDRGALKCKYCDTMFANQLSDSSPDLKMIEIIETGLRNGTITPNEARQKLGLGEAKYVYI